MAFCRRHHNSPRGRERRPHYTGDGMAEAQAAGRRGRFAALAWLASLLGAAAVHAAPPDAIVGSWLTDDGASRVEVSAAKAADGSSVYGGKVVWLKEPTQDGQPLRDAKNADAALRERPILGLPILSGFTAA